MIRYYLYRQRKRRIAVWGGGQGGLRENVTESIGEGIIIEEMDGWTDEKIKPLISKECR